MQIGVWKSLLLPWPTNVCIKSQNRSCPDSTKAPNMPAPSTSQLRLPNWIATHTNCECWATFFALHFLALRRELHTYGVWILRQTLHGVISLKTCAFAILFGAQVGESSAFALLILFKFSCAMRFTVSVLWPKIPGYSFRTSSTR